MWYNIVLTAMSFIDPRDTLMAIFERSNRYLESPIGFGFLAARLNDIYEKRKAADALEKEGIIKKEEVALCSIKDIL